jgi:hypothetical protein
MEVAVAYFPESSVTIFLLLPPLIIEVEDSTFLRNVYKYQTT